jgi:HEAT repeat protein
MLKDTSSLTPMTHAQLLQAYSNQTLSDEEKSSFLKQLDSTIENDQRLYALVRRGAYRAIGNLETSEAYKYLLHRLEADTFGECKEVIISSLARK